MRKEIIITLLLFLFSLSIYLFTTIPTTYWGDSAEFSTTSYLLDISHPPSYPIYNILGKLFGYIPVGNIAFRSNFFSAFFSSMTTIFIFLIVFYLPLTLDKISKFIVGSFSSFAFAFSLTFWQHSIKAEVYALFIFLFALIILLVLLFIQKNDIRYFYFSCFIFLISLTNHLLIIFSLTPLLFFILTYNYKIFINKKNLIILFLFSAMAFSIYLYLPLRSASDLKINWGRPNTLEGFKYVILIKEQGKLHQEIQPQKETKKEDIKKIREVAQDAFRPELTFQLFSLFIIFLPLYFSYLLVYKKEHYLSLKTKLIILVSFITIFIISLVSYFFKLPADLRKFLISEIGPSRVLELGVKHLINPIIDLISFLFIASFIFLSFTNKKRDIAKKISLVFVSILTICIYTIFPIASKGYKAGEFSFFIYLDILVNQFSIYLFPLGILGFIRLYFENFRIFAFLFFLFLCFGPLPIMIILPDNIPLVQERFSLPAYLVFSIFIGFGVKAIIEFGQKKIKLNYKYYPLLILSFIPLFLNFNQVNKNKYYLTKNYIDDIFLTLPKNSIILAKSIDTVFPLWYFNFVERKRSDITIVYIDALALKWYVDNIRENTNLVINNLEKKIKSEEQRRTLYIENIIKNHIDKRPIYYGGAPLFIPAGIKERTIIPEGILFKIIKTPRDKLTDKEIKRSVKLLSSYKFITSLSKIDYPAKSTLSIYAAGYYKLATNYLFLNKQELALKSLNKALKIDKTFTPTYSTLSQIYLQKGNINTAEKILKNGIKNNPKNIELIFQLAYLNFKTGNIDESIKLIDRVIKLQPKFIPAYLAKAEVYFAIGKKDEGKRVLESILKIEPDNQTATKILRQLE